MGIRIVNNRYNNDDIPGVIVENPQHGPEYIRYRNDKAILFSNGDVLQVPQARVDSYKKTPVNLDLITKAQEAVDIGLDVAIPEPLFVVGEETRTLEDLEYVSSLINSSDHTYTLVKREEPNDRLARWMFHTTRLLPRLWSSYKQRQAEFTNKDGSFSYVLRYNSSVLHNSSPESLVRREIFDPENDKEALEYLAVFKNAMDYDQEKARRIIEKNHRDSLTAYFGARPCV